MHTKCLTGYGCIKSEGLQAGEFFAPGLLHTVTEDVFPGIQLQQLDAPQQLIGLLQTFTRVFLPMENGKRRLRLHSRDTSRTDKL